MKNKVFAILGIALMLTSCTQKVDEIREEANKHLAMTIKEVARNPNSVEIKGLRECYADDSLCILSCRVNAANAFGGNVEQTIEYVYLTNDSAAYEAFHIITNDSVFVSPEVFEKTKSTTLQKDLSYEAALYTKAAKLVMMMGRMVGSKESAFVNLKIPNNTGVWEVMNPTDEFGQPTDNYFLLAFGKGTFSNSVTTGSNLTVALYINDLNPTFRFAEYDNIIVKRNDSGTLRIKEGNGTIHEYGIACDNNGNISFSFPWNDDSKETSTSFIELLKKGGVIFCHAVLGTYSPSDYQFALNVGGYEEAVAALKNIQYPDFKERTEASRKFVRDLTSNDPSVKTTARGLGYKFLREGTGAKPLANSMVTVHYEAKTIDGVVFDSSYKRGFPAKMTVNQTIPGFAEALQMMPEGSKLTAYIPCDLGYGEREAGGVKPYSTLIFDIELISIEK